MGVSGGSTFTRDFYVADAGNRRLVWLRREDSGPTWIASVAIEGVPSDCAVDHYGNVYVADRLNSRLLKYTGTLELLATYGSFGVGASSLNTFSHPRAIHVPFGQKTVGGAPVLYGEGRLLTAEDWTDDSGGLEHWLGVDIPFVYVTASTGAFITYRTTDHAYVTIELLRDATGGTVSYLRTSSFEPPGSRSFSWDGYLNDGTSAPADWYRIRVTATSGYGCDGSSWCRRVRESDPFYARGPETCSPDFPEGCEQPLERNVGLPIGLLDPDESVPTSFFLHQLVSVYSGPLVRRSGLSASLRGASGTGPGSLSPLVRSRGLMALTLGVPAGSAVPVTVRVYSLSGALVRELVRETVDPGEYAVGWDGTDRQGRAVPPGVYVAVMTAGGFRGIQRLIVPRR
jgi:hypothetical protein